MSSSESRAPECAIEVRALSTGYGTQTVLDGVDIRIECGRIVGYVGANGSGKTTTFRVLAGLKASFEGEVLVCGYDLRTETVEAQRCIGYMPESPELYETLTLAETCLFYGRLYGLEDATIRERATPLLEAFDLARALGQPMASFSKGMRQKALFTLALLHNPEVLILDEPFAGLDAESSRFLRDLLRALAARGKAILLSSHALNLVQEISDEVVILHGGQVAAHGPFHEIASQLRARSLDALVAELAGSDPVERQRDVERVLQAITG